MSCCQKAEYRAQYRAQWKKAFARIGEMNRDEEAKRETTKRKSDKFSCEEQGEERCEENKIPERIL